MRFTITPLGSRGGRTIGAVVADIVRYLEPRRAEDTRELPGVPSGDGPSSYYADRGTEPGRWLGHSATEAGLDGEVDPTDFARVLAGRDPRTGDRLINARGSAGRRPTLGAGNQTRLSPDGEPLYGVVDVAAALAVTRRDAQAMVAAGQRMAMSALAGPGRTDPPGSYLVPTVDDDGSVWVTQSELDRCELARTRGTSPGEVAAVGDADDLLSVGEAARLSGLTSRYVRSLCKRWDDHRDDIERTLVEDRTPGRAYLVAFRGTTGQWLIKRGDLVAFLERRIAPAVRVGYDLTLTTEKSLGVLALLGDQATRRAVLDAIEAGNDTGLRYLELHAAAARSRGQRALVRGLTIASFRHLTSRALDPFPHHHNVVANTVVDEHAGRRALDARGLYWHGTAASALATAEMRHQLTRSLGVRWRPSRSGGWEIDGISGDVVREFSRRRSEIEEAVAELEAAIGRRSSIDELQTVVTSTRPDKQDIDPSALVANWWKRARDHGLNPKSLAACCGHDLASPSIDRAAIFERLASPEEGLCADTSIFTGSDVLAGLVDLPVRIEDGPAQPLLTGAAKLQQLADDFLASSHVIQLDPGDLSVTSQLARESIFTTTEILGVQHGIRDRYVEGLSAGAAAADTASVSGALDDAAHLTGEQRTLVESFCTSGHAIQCAIGRAGAGKTSTMTVAADAWQRAGYRILGTAVKGEATRHLAEGASIQTETVAWILAHRHSPDLPLDKRTVLIVDEASTLSDRDLHALIDLCSQHGTALRLVGDPDQHGAVRAGGMFGYLCQHHPEHTPELATMHRVRDPADRAAAQALREGRAEQAIQLLEDAGHLHIAGNEVDLYLGMLNRWWAAHQAGDDHPMVDRRHHTRRQLNRLARRLLKANGHLGDIEIEASGDRAFAIGDRVVARMAARHLHVPGDPSAYLRNGAHGTVLDVQQGTTAAGDRLRVAFDGIGTVDVPRGFFDEHRGPGGRVDVGVDHAYAITSYSAQGATYPTSTSRIDEGATRSETYVDITRGRHANHLYLTRAADPLDGEHLPKVPPPPLPQAVTRRLSGSGPERAAIEFNAIDDRHPQAARAAAHQPPPAWTDRFPQPTTGPAHLHRLWHYAAEAVLTYRARWHPTTGDGPWEWAIGPSPTHPIASEQHRHVTERLDRFATAVAAEQLRSVGHPAHWATDTLRFALSTGLPARELTPLLRICQELASAQSYLAAGGQDVGEPDHLAPVLREVPIHEWLACHNRPARSGPLLEQP